MSVEATYDIKRRVAKKYSIIQVGICLFHKNTNSCTSLGSSASPKSSAPAALSFAARPFNFYLFPGREDDRDVVLSPSAITFLRRNGMDFQRWIYRGIQYGNESQEQKIIDEFKAKQQLEEGPSVVAAGEPSTDSSSGSQQQAVGLASEDEKRWFEASLLSVQQFSQDATGPKELMLPMCKSRNAREFLKRHVATNFPTVSVYFRGRGNNRDTVLVRTTLEEKQAQEAQRRMEDERAVLDQIGFRRIFNALVSSKKPCVGHNAFADFLFLTEALDRPLPEQVNGFKSRLSELFPVMFDTKFIANRKSHFPQGRFEQTHLEGLFEAYGGVKSQRVDITLPLGFHNYSEKTLVKSSRGGLLSHEAAFDALMTGTVLLNLIHEAGLTSVEEAAPVFSNKLALFRSLYALDVSSLDSDVYLPEGDVLLVEHKEGVKSHEVESCLAAVGSMQPSLYSVNATTTLAVLGATPVKNKQGTSAAAQSGEPLSTAQPFPTSLTGSEAATRLNDRFGSVFTAKVFSPPHVASSSAGAMRRTATLLSPKQLFRTALRALL